MDGPDLKMKVESIDIGWSHSPNNNWWILLFCVSILFLYSMNAGCWLCRLIRLCLVLNLYRTYFTRHEYLAYISAIKLWVIVSLSWYCSSVLNRSYMQSHISVLLNILMKCTESLCYNQFSENRTHYEIIVKSYGILKLMWYHFKRFAIGWGRWYIIYLIILLDKYFFYNWVILINLF